MQLENYKVLINFVKFQLHNTTVFVTPKEKKLKSILALSPVEFDEIMNILS